MRPLTSLLVLLFSMCGAQTRSAQTEVQTGDLVAEASINIYEELVALRGMLERQGATLIELTQILRFTQDQLQDATTQLDKMEAENNEQEMKLGAVTEQVVTSEAKVAAMKTEMETRLTSSEAEVEELKMKSAAQEVELTAIKIRLAATETGVVNLQKEIAEQPKVGFSAALTDSEADVESGKTDLNLVFTKVITNVGQAYSSTTGFFTAPVKGVYYFSFTVLDHLDSRMMTIKMVKNGRQVMRLYDYDDNGHRAYLSSAATLQLDEGDVVNMQLPAGYKLHDSADNHSTFSGFLLYPL